MQGRLFLLYEVTVMPLTWTGHSFPRTSVSLKPNEEFNEMVPKIIMSCPQNSCLVSKESFPTQPDCPGDT